MILENTKIHSVFYGALTPQELYKKDYPLLYSFNPETKLMEISKIEKIRLVEDYFTLYNTELDSGLNIFSEVDHSFTSFQGKPVAAKYLTIGQSIRAFSISLAKDGHYRVHGFVNGKAQHQYVARMVYEYFNGPIVGDQILHHKDFDKLNNFPDNLELLTNSGHNVVHYPFRRDGGFFRKNHKVIKQTVIEIYDRLVTVELDRNNTIIAADPVSVSGAFSGIVIGV